MNDTDTTVAPGDLEVAGVTEATAVADLDFPDSTAPFPTPARSNEDHPEALNGHGPLNGFPTTNGHHDPVTDPMTTFDTPASAARTAAAETAPSPAMANDPVTRPAVASRHAKRRNPAARKVTRFTLDLQPEQHQFLRMFAVSNSVEASKVMRALLYLLEVQEPLPKGVLLADLVLDEIFSEDETDAGAE